jgi:hypothetical protein
MKTCKVELKEDHLNKLSKATPVQAIVELIWNSLDADSFNIDISYHEGPLGIDKIIIKDDGTGILHDKFESLFGFLGGSWKARTHLTNGGRVIHGKEGQGRFKVFALGGVVTWEVVYKDKDKYFEYKINGFSETPNQFKFTDVKETKKKNTGVTIIIEELTLTNNSILGDSVAKTFLPFFALYLVNYKNISITIDNTKLNPSEVIHRKNILPLIEVSYKDTNYSSELEIIEWSTISNKDLFFCDEYGFTLEKYGQQIRGIGEFSYSAYIKSKIIRDLNDDRLLSISADKSIRELTSNAIDELKKYFLDRSIEESKTELQKWKDEEIYPYEKEPQNAVESAERQVFDIVAINVKNHIPDFDSTNKKSKAFQLRMLRQAIEKSPEELQTIVNEVLQLPKKKQAQLAELLQEVSLTAIISASRLVSDRLKFLSGLEHLIFDENSKKNLKERSQLHRIIAENTWLFGDAFTLSVDDQSLTEVLKKHAKHSKIDVHIDSPVKRVDGRVGIVDLMLSRSIPRNHSNELEHLVVELKAPKVVIGESEIQQIKSYAFAVAKDERFRSMHTRWHFWIISNDFDEYAELELDQSNHEEGVIYKSNKKINLTIWVKTWSQVIQEAKHRHEFIKEKLNYNIDKGEALIYLKQTYSEFTKGLLIDEANEKGSKKETVPEEAI